MEFESVNLDRSIYFGQEMACLLYLKGAVNEPISLAHANTDRVHPGLWSNKHAAMAGLPLTPHAKTDAIDYQGVKNAGGCYEGKHRA